MNPYYQDEFVTIYHGDCREIIPALGPVDLVLTDPPYGIDYQSAWRTEWQRKDKLHGDTEFPMWVFEICSPLVAMFVWCRWDIMRDLPKPKSYIVWDKGNHSMGDLNHEFGRQWEGVAFYPGPQHQFVKRPADIIVANRIPPLDLVHPTEKPVAALLPLLVAHKGNVLDPFMGSGSTLRAAKDLGRKAIGIEIEEQYCEVAAKRMAQLVMAL
jgi:site-specific DNA-methyltransferase (adenine-specific)